MTDRIDYLKMARLDGQGIVLLGAGGGGIGSATALALSGAGARVLCVDVNEQQAREAASSIGGEAVVADIRKRADMARVFSRARELFGNNFKGVVDVVGVAMIAPLETFDDEAVDAQFGIVFRHALLALQLAAPLLAENGGGAVTFVGSRSGIRPSPNQAIYGAFKAALHHLVRAAAMEFGPNKIRVNAVSPGPVRTPRLLKALSPEAWHQLGIANPLGRVADPHDIAKAILFLASDLAGYVTGNILVLDGAGDGNFQSVGLKPNLPGSGQG
jgi:NAD(P)-dependent dehydrogenase (short-subunit alcohol dehydrogenase family)